MSFFTELKRRNVFKIATSYAIVAWIMLQVVSTLSPALNIPAWVLSFVAVLLLLGFPLALYMAWAYEMTPDGIKPTADVTLEDSIRARTGQKMNYLIVGGLALLLAMVAADAFLLDGAPAVAEAVAVEATVPAAQPEVAAVSTNSIAVLPFENLSSDPEQEYFSDGLTEELLNQLAQVNDLQVAGRTSAFAFKNSGADAKTIGETLGVAKLLTGSVRKSGNQVRVNAQLATAADGVVMWSEVYDRELTDIFAIQDDIARDVTTALSITIGAGEFGRPGMTRNIEAYDAYLQGLSSYATFNGATEILKAIELMERAVTLDASFSQAWMRLIDIYRDSNLFLTAEQRADFPERMAEARVRIRAATPDLPELQLLDAQDLIEAGRLVEGERVFLDYLNTTGASNARAAIRYGTLLAGVGRRQEALRYFQQARRLEPLQIEASFQLLQALMALERYPETLAEIERGLSLEGLDQFISGQRFLLQLQLKDPRGALAALDQMAQTPPYNYTLVNLWIAGDIEGALAQVREIFMRPGAAGGTFTLMSQWATALGDPQLALDLRSGKGEASGLGPRRDVTGLWLPYASDMRKLPGFKDWMRELGIVDYWRTTGNWADLCRPVNDDFECF